MILNTLSFFCMSMVLPLVVAYGIFNAEFLAFSEISKTLWAFFNMIFVTSTITCIQLYFQNYIAKQLYNCVYAQKIYSPWVTSFIFLIVMFFKFILLQASYKISAIIAIYYQISDQQSVTRVARFLMVFSIFSIMASAYFDAKRLDVYTTSTVLQAEEEKQDVN